MTTLGWSSASPWHFDPGLGHRSQQSDSALSIFGLPGCLIVVGQSIPSAELHGHQTE